MSIFIIHNCSMQQSLEETWPKHKHQDFQNPWVRKDQWHRWDLQTLVQQWASTSIQPNIGNQRIKTSLTQLLLVTKLNQQDLSGRSIDKLTPLQEDNIRRNSLILSETMVIIQETSCLTLPWDRRTETSSSLLELPKWPATYQATMVSYPRLILIKLRLNNQKVKALETPSSSKILLKIRA